MIYFGLINLYVCNHVFVFNVYQHLCNSWLQNTLVCKSLIRLFLCFALFKFYHGYINKTFSFEFLFMILIFPVQVSRILSFIKDCVWVSFPDIIFLLTFWTSLQLWSIAGWKTSLFVWNFILQIILLTINFKFPVRL